MAQLHDEHLTIEQLSAAFDKQLSPQEQAVFDAHISSCQQCQNILADLRLTSVLLHALPEEEVPRSFVLPSSISILPDRTIRQDTSFTPVQRQHTQISMLRRSIRVVSTLAAVLALFFILSGMLPLIYPGGGSSTSTASSNSSSGEASTVHPAVSTPGVHQPNSVLPPRQHIRSPQLAQLRQNQVQIIRQIMAKALPSRQQSTSANQWYDLASVF